VVVRQGMDCDGRATEFGTGKLSVHLRDCRDQTITATDATNMTFAGTGCLQTPREANTATLLKDGTVLVTGGLNQTGILATAELYQ